MSSTIIGCLPFVIALASLVASDPATRIRLTNPNVINTENEYFGDWEVKFNNEDRETTKVYIKMPIKKELPPDMQIKFFLKMEETEPIEYAITVCEGMEDPVVGESIKEAGTPKGFGTSCPFLGGDYEIIDWNPPADKAPPSIPDGPFIGYADVMEEGKPYYIRMEFDGEIFHVVPGSGR